MVQDFWHRLCKDLGLSENKIPPNVIKLGFESHVPLKFGRHSHANPTFKQSHLMPFDHIVI